jgi:hypothetical protein
MGARQGQRPRRARRGGGWHRRTSLLATTIALGGVLIGAANAGAGQMPTAGAASIVNVKDEGRLRLVKSSGSQLIDEGPATGTIPGTARIAFVYDGDPTMSGQITIYGHGGNIQAHATGRLSSPTSASPSFKGTLTISGGTGRYAHARGSGQLYGVFYRRSYAITVQTQGTLRY